ncbi:hypothetical protein D3C81_1046470 [compost metagenome]
MNQALHLSSSPADCLPADLQYRPDGWGARPEDARHSALFDIQAEAEADILCRLLNLFALQGYLPAEVHAHQKDGWIQVRLRLHALPRHRAEVIAARMRSMVTVSEVGLSFHAC